MTDRLHIPKGKYARTGYVSPIDAALEIIGGKYKVAILYYIRESVLRFGELRRLMPLATKRMLTKQLRELERDGMIDRKVFRQVPPRVDYSLTKEGKSIVHGKNRDTASGNTVFLAECACLLYTILVV